MGERQATLSSTVCGAPTDVPDQPDRMDPPCPGGGGWGGANSGINLCNIIVIHRVRYAVYSGTSDNGHSEQRTTSLQWTHCSPPALLSIHFYLRRRDNRPTMDKMFTPCLYTFLPPRWAGGRERERKGEREDGREGWERGNESGRKVKYMYKRRVGQKKVAKVKKTAKPRRGDNETST